MRLAARMPRRTNGLVIALERMATAFDRHFRLGAARSCERRFNTGLPVLSDLIRMIGSSLLPTRVTVPPDGPLIDARSPAAPVTTP